MQGVDVLERADGTRLAVFESRYWMDRVLRRPSRAHARTHGRRRRPGLIASGPPWLPNGVVGPGRRSAAGCSCWSPSGSTLASACTGGADELLNQDPAPGTIANDGSRPRQHDHGAHAARDDHHHDGDPDHARSHSTVGSTRHRRACPGRASVRSRGCSPSGAIRRARGTGRARCPQNPAVEWTFDIGCSNSQCRRREQARGAGRGGPASRRCSIRPATTRTGG